MPVSTWERQYAKATGFFSSRLDPRNTKGSICHSSSFRFLIKTPEKGQTVPGRHESEITYGWTEIGLWTQWCQGHSSVLLCRISGPAEGSLRESIKASLREHPTPFPDSCPHSWHGFVIPHISRAFHIAVWKCRDLIRTVETTRPDVHKPRADYATLHELSRHAAHSSETISMAVTVLNSTADDLLAVQKSLQGEEAVYRRVFEELNCQRTLLHCEHGRSQALESRLRNEIDLVRFSACSCSGHCS